MQLKTPESVAKQHCFGRFNGLYGQLRASGGPTEKKAEGLSKVLKFRCIQVPYRGDIMTRLLFEKILFGFSEVSTVYHFSVYNYERAGLFQNLANLIQSNILR